MNLMKKIFTLFTILLSLTSFAYIESNIKMGDNHFVYFKYQQAQPGKPTVVLFNGLLFYASAWDSYFDKLRSQGYGVLQPIYSTQPESLQLLKGETPYFAKMVMSPYGLRQQGLETQTFVDEFMAVIDHLNIDRFSIASLSYGSTVSSELALQNKDRIDHFILISPAVVPTNRYNFVGETRYNYYLALKNNPFTLKGYADYLYDVEFYSMLTSLIRPEHLRFPGVSFQDYFNGLYQMNRSVKWFDLFDYADTDLPPTYMFLASEEEEKLQADQLALWEEMNKFDYAKSLVQFEGAAHALTWSAPLKAAQMTIKVLENQLTMKEYTVVVTE